MKKVDSLMLSFPNDAKSKTAWQVYASSFKPQDSPADCGRKLFPEVFDFQENKTIEPLSILAVKCLANNYTSGPISSSIDAFSKIKLSEFLDIEIPVADLIEIEVSLFSRI